MLPFFILMKAMGIFRVAEEDEVRGLDDSKHVSKVTFPIF